MSESEYVLAADVGGTNLRVAAVDAGGKLLRRAERDTPGDGTAEDVLDVIVSEAQSLVTATSDRPRSFGVAVAALVDPDRGLIYRSPNLPQLNGLDLGSVLAKRMGIDVVVENDATAAAVGEHWLGSGEGVENMVCLTLGTGVGGGLILNGRPYRGACGTAGELGHICVEPDGASCGCGSRGCLEQYASATAIVRIATELLRQNRVSRLIDDFSARDVYNAALEDDQVACETFERVGLYLGRALGDLVNILNPQLIVIGGGGAGSWDKFIDHTWAEVRSRAFHDPVNVVHIVRALLGPEAGLVGVARVAWDSLDPERNPASN